MDLTFIPLALLIYVVPVAVLAVLLYFVVRAAVLSALRAHHRETNGPGPNSVPPTHLDA